MNLVFFTVRAVSANDSIITTLIGRGWILFWRILYPCPGFHIADISAMHRRYLWEKRESFRPPGSARTDTCPRLWEYASLVGRVKENLTDGMSIRASVEEAVNYCLNRGILTDFLMENRSGVLGMLRLLTEYDEKKHIRLLKRDAREEGMLQERATMILELLSGYGDVPAELQTAITDQKDLPTLREWSRIAAGCGSIEAFLEQTECLG